MGKLDEQLIQLINNEIEGKGGGFEEFCTLASEVVQPVVKKVFPKNETLYKKAVKQILVRMYQKIEMADMNQIQEWMERFALDVLEKNYPRETAAAKKREARPEQETVKNEESLQKSARTEEQEQDELIAAAMAAFAKLQDGQPEEQVELPEEVQSFFEPEQPKEQDLQDTQELQIEITQPAGQQQETADISQTGPAAQKSDENPAGQTAQESEELSMEDDETEDIEGFSLESDGDEDDGDEFEEEPSDVSSFWNDRSNVKKILIAAIPCVIAVIVVVVLLAGGKKKQPVSVNHSMSTTAKQTETTTVSTQAQPSSQTQTAQSETQEQTERTTAQQTAEQTTKKTQASTKSRTTTQRTQKQDSTESPEKTDDSGDNNTQEDTEPATEEKTKEPETQRPAEEKTTPEATEGTTQNNTKATIKKIQ